MTLSSGSTTGSVPAGELLPLAVVVTESLSLSPVSDPPFGSPAGRFVAVAGVATTSTSFFSVSLFSVLC